MRNHARRHDFKLPAIVTGHGDDVTSKQGRTFWFVTVNIPLPDGEVIEGVRLSTNQQVTYLAQEDELEQLLLSGETCCIEVSARENAPYHDILFECISTGLPDIIRERERSTLEANADQHSGAPRPRRTPSTPSYTPTITAAPKPQATARPADELREYVHIALAHLGDTTAGEMDVDGVVALAVRYRDALEEATARFRSPGETSAPTDDDLVFYNFDRPDDEDDWVAAG